jgi:hypothetical protein
MRAPAVFAVIALATFIPAVHWAEAGAARTVKSPAVAAQQNSLAHPKRMIAPTLGSGRSPQPHTAGQPAARSAAAISDHAAQHLAPSRGHLAPIDLGRRFAAPQVGGPSRYDAKKGAVIGGAPMLRKR